MKRKLALFLSLLLLLSLFAGCVQPVDGPGMENSTGATQAPPATDAPPVTDAPPADEYTLEREPGTNQLIFYWKVDNVDLSKRDMWIWYPNADGRG